jgi:hypothetical protein
MDSAELAAYIGAAAWAPHLLSWAHNFLTAPRVRIIPDKSIEIGFTSNGPILNLTLAISSENKDSLIDNINIQLRHEEGDVHEIIWQGYEEKFSILDSNSAIHQTVKKDGRPIALKISTDGLVERFFRFQDDHFWIDHREKSDALINQIEYLRRTNNITPEDTEKLKEYESFSETYTDHFWWKTGTYRVKFQISSPNASQLIDSDFYFSLSKKDVEMLSANKIFVKQEFKNALFSAVKGYESTQIRWNWRYVNLRKNA